MADNRSGLSSARPSRNAGTPASTAAILAGDDLARVTFQLDAEKHRRFKAALAAEGVSMKDYLTDQIDEYLRSH